MTAVAVENFSERLSDPDVAFMAAACHEQLVECARAWNLDPWAVSHYKRGTVLPPQTTHVMSVVDEIDVPGALGYHDDIGGVIYGKVLAQDPAGTSVTLSHECLETLVDPDAARWVGDYALEACDAVEADVYPVNATVLGETRQVLLSNFVLPNWFDPTSHAGPYDRMGKLSAPLEMTPGGYVIKRNPDGTSRIVFARKGSVPDAFYRKLVNPKSRTMQRIRQTVTP